MTRSAGSSPAALRWLLLCVTAAALLCCSCLLGLGLWPLATWTWIAILASVIGGALVIATALAWRAAPLGRGVVAGFLILGVAFRLAAVPARHFLSDDADRYHWDGKVFAHGINPYRFAPQDPALDHLRTDARDADLARAGMRTVYPPLAQVFFALGYVLSPGRLLGLQGLMLACEVTAWLLLVRELRRRRLPLSYVLLVAWSPLLVYQGYLPGHVDMLMLPFIVLFIAALDRRAPLTAAVALALACLIKPHAVVFAPAAVRPLGWRGSALFGAVFAAIVAGAYLPFLSPGPVIFSGVARMAEVWSFNGSLAALLQSHLPRTLARATTALLMLACVILAAWRGKDNLSRLLLAVAAFVAWSPNLFPWYLFLVVPLLVLRPDPALLALTILIPISETVTLDFRLSGVWRQPLWVRLAEYVPFYLVLGLGAWRRWGMFERGPTR